MAKIIPFARPTNNACVQCRKKVRPGDAQEIIWHQDEWRRIHAKCLQLVNKFFQK